MREAHALKAAGRLDEAVRRYGEAVAANPRSGAAEHALAACLGEDGRWDEAEAHVRAAFAKGLDTPETWLVKGRCELALGRLDAAEMAFREALKRRDDLHAAVQELVQLSWRRTGDLKAALAALVPADGVSVSVIKARVLEAAGEAEGAFALMAEASAAAPLQAGLAVEASRMAAQAGRSVEAVTLAMRAQKMAPHELPVLIALAEALLCAGEAQKASDIVGDMRRTWSTNQHAIALQATAWRMLGDARYRVLCDYPQLVGTEMLEAPAGWASLEAYLADVASGAEAAASVRGAAVRIAGAAREPCRRHCAAGASGAAGPAPRDRWCDAAAAGAAGRRRRSGAGAQSWGVQAAGHVVGDAWAGRVRSRSCAAAGLAERGSSCGDGRRVTDAMRFGQPGLRTHPMLQAEHVVAPKPGMLVLFPSYVWQGCEPVQHTQLSLSFDVLPGPVKLADDRL